MYVLIDLLLNLNSLIPFFFFIYVIVLFVIKKKINEKVWRVLCIVPLIVAAIHYYIYYVPNGFQMSRFLFLYLFPFVIIAWQFFYNKKKLFKIMSIITIVFGFVSFCLTFYSVTSGSQLHVLTRYSYTESFEKAIEILKNEYVLNEHKNIDYDSLYNTYYPLVKEAEETKNEQLYFKTMFEFSTAFKDAHVSFGIYADDIEELPEKILFMDDYTNRDYGFASVMLSDGNIVAMLVEENGEAYNQGLRDGMIITKKNNIIINEELNNVKLLFNQYPVLEDEKFIKSFYLFATGTDTISLSFIGDDGIEKTIEVKSIEDYTSKPDDLYWKFMYYDQSLGNYDTKMIDDNTGYINIAHECYSPIKATLGYVFDDSSYYLSDMIEEKIDKLIKQGMTNLIIDIRGNSGGYFTESTAIASLFTKDTYLVSKLSKYHSDLYDEVYLNGTGKYSDLKLTVLVNADTVSSGDGLAYILSKNSNATLVGFTNTNHSFQSTGGRIFLSGGYAYFYYPVVNSLNEQNQIMIDPDSRGLPYFTVDEKVIIDETNVKDIVYSAENYDWLLEYVKNKY